MAALDELDNKYKAIADLTPTGVTWREQGLQTGWRMPESPGPADLVNNSMMGLVGNISDAGRNKVDWDNWASCAQIHAKDSP
jgi:hypothetical protein